MSNRACLSWDGAQPSAPLGTGTGTAPRTQGRSLTFSAICRTESNLMTLEDAPSRGTLAAGHGDVA